MRNEHETFYNPNEDRQEDNYERQRQAQIDALEKQYTIMEKKMKGNETQKPHDNTGDVTEQEKLETVGHDKLEDVWLTEQVANEAWMHSGTSTLTNVTKGLNRLLNEKYGPPSLHCGEAARVHIIQEERAVLARVIQGANERFLAAKKQLVKAILERDTARAELNIVEEDLRKESELLAELLAEAQARIEELEHLLKTSERGRMYEV